MIVPTILYISLIVSAIMIIIGFLNLKNVYNIYMLMSGGLLLLLIGIFVLVNGGVTAQTGLVETTNFTYEEVLFPNTMVSATNNSNTSFALTSSVSTVNYSYETMNNLLTNIMSWVFVLGGMALMYFSWDRFINWKREKDEGEDYNE